ncbi:MAG TPA: hypothetical protein DDZ51_14910 [Planctomycetaceae bacterium]|nr:hypothetical protein [Planctomycetaceae bacterium]
MARKTNGPGVSFFAFQDIITSVVGIFILITILLILDFLQRVEASVTKPEAVYDAAPIREAITTLEAEVAAISQLIETRINSHQMTVGINQFNRIEKLDALKAQLDASQQHLRRSRALADDLARQIAAAQGEAFGSKSQQQEIEKRQQELASVASKIQTVENQLAELQNDATPIFRDVTEQGRFLTLVILNDQAIELKDAITKSKQIWRGSSRLDQFRTWLNETEMNQRQLYIIIKPGSASDFSAMRVSLDRSNATYGFNVSGDDETVLLGFEKQ